MINNPGVLRSEATSADFEVCGLAPRVGGVASL
jgi:hypothetical protein